MNFFKASCGFAAAFRAITGIVAFAGASGLYAESTYPQRPVTVVVAFAPGGMTDSVSRALARELDEIFKQPFVIENKPGAAGQVATEYVARRPADGYTLLVSATGHVIAPVMQKKVHYDPVKDFEPIAILAKVMTAEINQPRTLR